MSLPFGWCNCPNFPSCLAFQEKPCFVVIDSSSRWSCLHSQMHCEMLWNHLHPYYISLAARSRHLSQNICRCFLVASGMNSYWCLDVTLASHTLELVKMHLAVHLTQDTVDYQLQMKNPLFVFRGVFTDGKGLGQTGFLLLFWQLKQIKEEWIKRSAVSKNSWGSNKQMWTFAEIWTWTLIHLHAQKQQLFIPTHSSNSCNLGTPQNIADLQQEEFVG